MSEQSESSPTIYHVIQSSQNHSQISISQEFIKTQIEDKISGIHKKIINLFGKKQNFKLKTKSTTQKSQNQKINIKSESNQIFFSFLLQNLSSIETQFIQAQLSEIRLGEKLNAIINKILYFGLKKVQPQPQSQIKAFKLENTNQNQADQFNQNIKAMIKILYDLPFMIDYCQNVSQLQDFDISNGLKQKQKNQNWQTEIVLQKFINQNQELRTENEKLKTRISELEQKNLDYFDKIYKIGQSSPYFSRINQQKQRQKKQKLFTSQFHNNSDNSPQLPQTTTSLKQYQRQRFQKQKQIQYSQRFQRQRFQRFQIFQIQREKQIKKITEAYQGKIYQLDLKLKKKNSILVQMDSQFKNQIQKYNSVFKNLENEIIILKRELSYWQGNGRGRGKGKVYGQEVYGQSQGCCFQKEKMEEIIFDLNQEIKRLQFQKQKQNDLQIINEIQRTRNMHKNKMSRYNNNYNNNQSYSNPYQKYQNNRPQFYPYHHPYENGYYGKNEQIYVQVEDEDELNQQLTLMRTSNFMKNNKNSRITHNNLYNSPENHPIQFRFTNKRTQQRQRMPKQFRSYSPIQKSRSIYSRKPQIKLYSNSQHQQIDQRSKSRHKERLEQMKKSLFHNKFVQN